MEVNLLYLYNVWGIDEDDSKILIGIYSSKNSLYQAIYSLIENKYIKSVIFEYHCNMTLKKLKTLELKEINKIFGRIYIETRYLNQIHNDYKERG